MDRDRRTLADRRYDAQDTAPLLRRALAIEDRKEVPALILEGIRPILCGLDRAERFEQRPDIIQHLLAGPGLLARLVRFA